MKTSVVQQTLAQEQLNDALQIQYYLSIALFIVSMVALFFIYLYFNLRHQNKTQIQQKLLEEQDNATHTQLFERR
jgi:Na+/H+ antiporter NhaC